MTPTGLPQDEAARAEIRTRLGVSQFVEAGAGTGKTTALVSRILELVMSGEATIDHIAAITFTDAAAAELRDRIYEALERASTGDEGPSGTGPEGSPPADGRERRARARAALDEIDGAAICTLHGFAQRILAAHPFGVGLPPGFEVLDEGRSAAAFDERWDDFVDRLLEDAAFQDVLRRLLVSGVRIDHLRTVAELCNENWDLLTDAGPDVPTLGPIDPSVVIDALDAATADAATCTAADDKLRLHIEGLSEFRAAVRAAASDLEILELLADLPQAHLLPGPEGQLAPTGGGRGAGSAGRRRGGPADAGGRGDLRRAGRPAPGHPDVHRRQRQRPPAGGKARSFTTCWSGRSTWSGTTPGSGSPSTMSSNGC